MASVIVGGIMIAAAAVAIYNWKKISEDRGLIKNIAIGQYL
jgi:hypothetical protein